MTDFYTYPEHTPEKSDPAPEDFLCNVHKNPDPEPGEFSGNVPEKSDLVAQAQAALQQAALDELAAESELTALKAQAIAAVSTLLAVDRACYVGLLRNEDDEVAEAKTAVAESHQRLKAARQVFASAQQRVVRAKAAIGVAERQQAEAQQERYLQVQHPEMWQRYQDARQALAEFRPNYLHEPGASLRTKATLQQALDAIEAEIAAALEAAEAHA